LRWDSTFSFSFWNLDLAPPRENPFNPPIGLDGSSISAQDVTPSTPLNARFNR
jgi:hypothetical protein